MKSTYYSESTINQAYIEAEKTMKIRAVSFYNAFSKLPHARFRGVCALYAFCRFADDAVDQITDQDQVTDVDQNPEQTHDRHHDTFEASRKDILSVLDTLEYNLRSLYDDAESKTYPPPEYPWWPAFEDTVIRFNIPLESFLSQIEGQKMDLFFSPPETLEELIHYSRLVAGSVGTMMLPILAKDDADLKSPDFRRACEHLGIGMQITNILRDVGEDLRSRNRIYLPVSLLHEYGVDTETLKHLSAKPENASISDEIPDGFIRLWEHLADVADHYYRSYEKWLPWFLDSCQMPLAAAALVYNAISDAVRKSGYNCFTVRNYTDKRKRAALILKAARLVSTI